VRETATLLKAWHAIRRNGETSRSRKTREATKLFGADLPRQLRRIQERLRKAPYKFSPQIGATPEKTKGQGKRPLVIAPMEDRIVQRAILDVLQDSPDLPQVRKVLETPTSIGGIRGRGVEHAIDLIENAYRAGNANFIAGSDISGFFTQISQSDVVAFIRQQTDDSEFVELLANALKVELVNAADMDPIDLKMFPTDETGVAQGCPLSAFAGNVVLQSFDTELNGRGITCIRYIDDFIILGRRRGAVLKAFESASDHLAKMGMSIYRPETRPDKAFCGAIGDGFEFLGYKIVPGVYPPAEKNRQNIIKSVGAEIEEGRRHILRTLHRDTNGKPLQRFVQTLAAVDGLLRAWSGSFRASRCLETAKIVDEAVNELISGFIGFYQQNVDGRTRTERRRALGIHVLLDDVRQRLARETKDQRRFAGSQGNN
jgi:retron-type reverse transcriptase